MGNLLIVDDEVDLAVNMKELLEEEAQYIFIANDGQKALEILRNHRIDCVVSDVKMPVMDGLKFIQEARKAGMKVPFIFYTGHGSQELRNQVRALGAKDLLTKPNFANLELAVREAMSEAE